MFHLRGADAFQQRAGGFVFGVLRYQLAGEGGFEDVFALGGGLLERKLNCQFLLLDALDLGVDLFHQSSLLVNCWDGDHQRKEAVLCQVQTAVIYARLQFVNFVYHVRRV
ncbi:hypothetical protein B1991_17430 [Rhodanobacter lindaniclasticus]|uniref:Uncharacterized protein n=1 Tax=Rhodanobacter lindaniclasticus TaxID=75310 RepID=A0A4S3K7Y4_9GAMM|nr:hypothetical protein B1991_17430 [Rhodanobacter lindaniclasticus]